MNDKLNFRDKIAIILFENSVSVKAIDQLEKLFDEELMYIMPTAFLSEDLSKYNSLGD
jgi:hypothetical protein